MMLFVSFRAGSNLLYGDKEAGALYEELLIANCDLEKQAAANHLYLDEQKSQMTLFDFKTNYTED